MSTLRALPGYIQVREDDDGTWRWWCNRDGHSGQMHSEWLARAIATWHLRYDRDHLMVTAHDAAAPPTPEGADRG